MVAFKKISYDLFKIFVFCGFHRFSQQTPIFGLYLIEDFSEIVDEPTSNFTANWLLVFSLSSCVRIFIIQ